MRGIFGNGKRANVSILFFGIACHVFFVIPAEAGIYRFILSYYVYIVTNRKNGTIYIGITNDLVRRIYEHKTKLVTGFTKKYNLSKLVYYEQTSDIASALAREKQMKKWNRQWKIELIEKLNPDWKDLFSAIAK